MFPVGSTSVQCRVVDAAEQSATCLFDVTITVPPIPQLTRTRFLAFGDSMTAGEISTPIGGQGTGGPNFKLIVVPAASYPMQLADALKARYTTQAASIVVQNFGLPGEWANDGARRLPGVLATNRPDVVLLMEGYNDIGSQLPVQTNAAVVALDAMAKEVRNRGARVMLATLPPPRPGGTHSLPTKVVTDFNAWVRSIAQGEGAILVDLYAGMSTDVTRYIGVDGLHPTEAGYARMAELFHIAIRANLEVR